MKFRDTLALAAFVAVIGFAIYQESNEGGAVIVDRDPVVPDWTAIAAWPDREAEQVEVQPNPNRRVTAIVLDDSASMGDDIVPAKAAVVGALDAMDDDDRVAVLALNAGVILPFASVNDARRALPDLLRPINSDGGTPLAQSIRRARGLLEAEAASARAFGTFRLIVTTDGAANDGDALIAVIEDVATATPIQIATIGIDVSNRHVLRRDDIGSFVDVANVGALEEALQAAIAENTDFTAITEFGETEG